MRRLPHMCGCLALVLVNLLAWDARAQVAFEEEAIGYALENLVSGTSTMVQARGTTISVTPLRTWKSVSGHWCRRYELTVAEAGGAPQRSEATRCRQDGIWKHLPKN